MAKKRMGLAIDVLAILLIIGLVVWNYHRSRPGPAEPAAEPVTGSGAPAVGPAQEIEDVAPGPVLPPAPAQPPPGASRVTGIAVCALDRTPIRRGTLLARAGSDGEGAVMTALDSEGRFAFDWTGPETGLSLGLAHEEYESPGWVDVSFEGGEAGGEPGDVRDLGAVAFEIRGHPSVVEGDIFWKDPSDDPARETSEPVLLRFVAFACDPGLLEIAWGIPKSPALVLPGSAREDLARMRSEGLIKSSAEVLVTTDGGISHTMAITQKAFVQDAGRSPEDPGGAWSPVVGVDNTGMVFQARAVAGDGAIEILDVEGMRSFHLGTCNMAAKMHSDAAASVVRWEEPVTLYGWLGPLPDSVFLQEGDALLLDLALETAPRQGTAHLRAHALQVEESYAPASPESEDPMRLEHHVLITAERAGTASGPSDAAGSAPQEGFGLPE
jgi:hypothetical protein